MALTAVCKKTPKFIRLRSKACTKYKHEVWCIVAALHWSNAITRIQATSTCGCGRSVRWLGGFRCVAVNTSGSFPAELMPRYCVRDCVSAIACNARGNHTPIIFGALFLPESVVIHDVFGSTELSICEVTVCNLCVITL